MTKQRLEEIQTYVLREKETPGRQIIEELAMEIERGMVSHETIEASQQKHFKSLVARAVAGRFWFVRNGVEFSPSQMTIEDSQYTWLLFDPMDNVRALEQKRDALIERIAQGWTAGLRTQY